MNINHILAILLVLAIILVFTAIRPDMVENPRNMYVDENCEKTVYRLVISDGLGDIECLSNIRSGSNMSNTIESLEQSIDIAVIAAWTFMQSADESDKMSARLLLSNAKEYRIMYPRKIESTIGSLEWNKYVRTQMEKVSQILDDYNERGRVEKEGAEKGSANEN